MIRALTSAFVVVASLALVAPAIAYEGGPVTDGGTISGHVKYGGPAPTPAKIEITKDQKVCGAEGAKIKEDLLVGASGGVKNAVVRLVGIQKGAALATQTPNPTLDQRVCQFRPHVVLVPAGATLDVLNSDGILHNVHTYSQANTPINKAQPGFKKQIQLQFEKPEFPIRLECDAHPWMRGWLVVQDHPYYAVTDDSGAFSLANVPAGAYDVEVWHETLGRQTAKATVAAKGTAAVDVTFAAK